MQQKIIHKFFDRHINYHFAFHRKICVSCGDMCIIYTHEDQCKECQNTFRIARQLQEINEFLFGTKEFEYGDEPDTRIYRQCSKENCERYEMIPYDNSMCKGCRTSLLRFFK